MCIRILSPISNHFFCPLKHTDPIWTAAQNNARILSVKSRTKLNSLIFCHHTRSRSISSDWVVIFFSSSLAQHPNCLPAGGPGCAVRSTGEQLLLLRRVYLRLHYENCHHLPLSNASQREKKDKKKGIEGRKRKGNWFFFIVPRGILGTPLALFKKKRKGKELNSLHFA